MLAKELDGVCGNSVLEKSLKTQNTTSGAEDTQGTKATQTKEKHGEFFDLLHNLYSYLQIGSVALRADAAYSSLHSLQVAETGFKPKSV